MKRSLRLMLSVLIMPVMLAGCNEWGIIRPKTELRVNPLTKTVTFVNTKDVTSNLDKLEVRWASTQPADGPAESSGSFVITDWDLIDNASNPQKANVEQMAMAVKQMEQTNEMIKSAFAGLSNLTASLTPLVGQIQQASVQMAALKNNSVGADIKGMIAQAIKEQIAQAVTTRPAEPTP